LLELDPRFIFTLTYEQPDIRVFIDVDIGVKLRGGWGVIGAFFQYEILSMFCLKPSKKRQIFRASREKTSDTEAIKVQNVSHLTLTHAPKFKPPLNLTRMRKSNSKTNA
jgi:hypothetical protein